LWPQWPKLASSSVDMQTLSARDAKYNFGRLIDTARAEPVTVEKHGRAVVVVLAVEEYERLKTIESEQQAKESEQQAKAVGSGGKK
jgi:prevent-host-death family protein